MHEAYATLHMQLVTSEEADGFFCSFTAFSPPSVLFTECDYAKAGGTIGKVFFSILGHATDERSSDNVALLRNY